MIARATVGQLEEISNISTGGQRIRKSNCEDARLSCTTGHNRTR